MRGFLFFLAIAVCSGVNAQKSDLIIRSADSIVVMVNLDGREYKMDGASVIKITDIPEAALINVTIMLQSATPKVYFSRHEFKGSFEWSYRLVNPVKKNMLLLEEVSIIEKTDEFVSNDLGENFVTYIFKNYTTPSERYRGTVDAASSMSMKRTKEETPLTTKIEDGVTVEEKSSRNQTVKKQGSSTVIHQERKTTAAGDNRETSILRPRKESCDDVWEDDKKEEQMDSLAMETYEAGKLYMSKTIAIGNCMNAKDAIEIINVFDTEATRIEMAKFIYPSIVDKENFNLLSDSFDSISSWQAVKLYVDIKYNR